MARSDAVQLKSDAGGSERLQDSAGAAFTQLLCQQLASKMALGSLGSWRSTDIFCVGARFQLRRSPTAAWMQNIDSPRAVPCRVLLCARAPPNQ